MKYFEIFYALKVWGFYASMIILAVCVTVVVGCFVWERISLHKLSKRNQRKGGGK